MSQTIADIGEFGLIRRIETLIENNGFHAAGVTAGIGDDCAVFRPRPGHDLLATCDCLVEGRHFLPGRMSFQDLGRRAMVQNISDIGAMGGMPLYGLISLGLQPDMPIAHVEALYQGFLQELNPLEAAIVGGNVTSSEKLFIDITLLGQVEQGKAVYRSTAKPGDVLLVTGFPGQAAAGLRLLADGGPSKQENAHTLVQAYLVPVHRAREGRALAAAGVVQAMIDTSDGLIGDLGHLCGKSRVGAILDREKLPIGPALEVFARDRGLDPLDLVLGESDDYELLLSCLPGQVEEVRRIIQKTGELQVTEIGLVTERAEQGIQIRSKDGRLLPLTPSGWDHFCPRSKRSPF